MQKNIKVENCFFVHKGWGLKAYPVTEDIELRNYVMISLDSLERFKERFNHDFEWYVISGVNFEDITKMLHKEYGMRFFTLHIYTKISSLFRNVIKTVNNKWYKVKRKMGFKKVAADKCDKRIKYLAERRNMSIEDTLEIENLRKNKLKNNDAEAR